MATKTKRLKSKALKTTPKLARQSKPTKAQGYPISRLSASSMVKFTTNPILWKINAINGDYFDTATNIAAVIGRSVHAGLEAYYGGNENMPPPATESEALATALTVGAEAIAAVPEGFINFSESVSTKEKASAIVAFCLNSYIKEHPFTPERVIALEQKIQHEIDVEYAGQRVHLPIPLLGYLDRLERDAEGRLVVVDYKTCYSFSNPDKIDAAKIIQAVVYYLLVLAEYGHAPYSIKFQEIKYTQNRDGSPQVREYEVVYADNPLYFDLFFRLYEDILHALMGEMVYVPNFHALYDNEVAIVAYIHRLDVNEERAKMMRKHNAKTITEVLSKEVHNTANLQRLLNVVEEKFIEAKTIDYAHMTTQERIATKFAEFGIAVRYDSKVEGATVTRYRFTPSTGIRMKTIRNHDADVEQAIGARGVRVLAPEPGTSFVSFEVPNTERVFYGAAPAADGIRVPIGVGVDGTIQYLDIADAPHLLIAGTTGGGKSYMLRSILASLGQNAELWLADPKGVELKDFQAAQYAESPEDIRALLEKLVGVMDERFEAMKAGGERTYSGTPIVCVVDEFADFMQSDPGGEEAAEYGNWTIARLRNEFDRRGLLPTEGPILQRQDYIGLLTQDDCIRLTKYSHLSGEGLIVKLAQKARAAGIHLILATQRPSVKVVTGLIKANIPTRIALRTTEELESRIILDQPGAEKLLGKGDALLLRSDSSELVRLQGFSA